MGKLPATFGSLLTLLPRACIRLVHAMARAVACELCAAGGAGRANEAASGLEELKALDVIVTGMQLERLIERGQAVAADVAARYAAAQQADAVTLAPIKRKKVTAARSCFGPCHLRAALRIPHLD